MEYLLIIIVLAIIAWLTFCYTAVNLFKDYPMRGSYHSKNERIVK
jgi:hypothetical protein